MAASIAPAFSATYYSNRNHLLYYLTGDAGIGLWYGGAAEPLGFRGQVLPEALEAAFEGYSANGLKQLVQLQGGNRQPAWDICFSAPKWLSVLWSVSSPYWRHRIEEIVLRAVKLAVDQLEENALFTRRGKYGCRVEKAKAVVALIPHGMSRGYDPQLHIHVFWINACLRADGTTGTIRSRDLYEHKMAAGAVFHLELAHLLFKELGLVTVRDKDNPWTFKLPGVSEELCQEQSKRSEEILKLAIEAGWDSPQVRSRLAIASRKPKGHVELSDCSHKWQETGQAFGFGINEAEQLFLQGQERLQITSKVLASEEERQSFLAEAVDKAVAQVATTEAYFPQRKILQEVNTLLQGHHFSASEVIEAVEKRLEVHYPEIEIPARAEHRFYSTKENIAAEKELLERVANGKDSQSHLATEVAVERAIQKEEQLLSKALGTKAELTTDQKSSFRHIALEPGLTKLVQGMAGTGKTQLLSAAYRAWKECGYQVIGCSVTGRAAKVLEKTTGIPSVTVAALLHTLRPELTPKEFRRTFSDNLKSAVATEMYEARRAGRWMRNPFKEAIRELANAIKAGSRERRPQLELTSKTILVVDEIATLSTKGFLSIQQLCDRANAKLVGVGDRFQLPPIEAGGPFWSVANVTGCGALNTIVRQRHEWMKRAVESVLADRPLDALQLYAKNDSLHIAKHKTAAIESLVHRYSTIKAAKLPHVAALTTTNKDASRINQAMQQKRKAANELGLSWTKLANGAVVHKGDIVVLRENDYRIGVRNGMRGTVVGIQRPRGPARAAALRIQLHGEKQGGFFCWRPKTIAIDLKKYPLVQLGYAVTTHLAQGTTLKESLVLLGDEMNSKNMAYTQLSRHTDRCTLYATEAAYGDSMQYLAKQISKSVQKDLALDYKLITDAERKRKQEQQQQMEQGHDLSLSFL